MTTRTRTRIDYTARPTAFGLLQELHGTIDAGPLEPALLELVRMRVSQLNGCAFCLDLHARAARAAGETEQRLDVLAAWREAGSFSDRERAALAFAEAVTLLAGRGVPDAAIYVAEEHFAVDELATLLYAVAEINAWNRLAVAGRTPVPERRG